MSYCRDTRKISLVDKIASKGFSWQLKNALFPPPSHLNENGRQQSPLNQHESVSNDENTVIYSEFNQQIPS